MLHQIRDEAAAEAVPFPGRQWPGRLRLWDGVMSVWDGVMRDGRPRGGARKLTKSFPSKQGLIVDPKTLYFPKSTR